MNEWMNESFIDRKQEENSFKTPQPPPQPHIGWKKALKPDPVRFCLSLSTCF